MNAPLPSKVLEQQEGYYQPSANIQPTTQNVCWQMTRTCLWHGGRFWLSCWLVCPRTESEFPFWALFYLMRYWNKCTLILPDVYLGYEYIHSYCLHHTSAWINVTIVQDKPYNIENCTTATAICLLVDLYLHQEVYICWTRVRMTVV